MGGASRIPASNVEGAVRERAMTNKKGPSTTDKKSGKADECPATLTKCIKSKISKNKQPTKPTDQQKKKAAEICVKNCGYGVRNMRRY